MLTTKLRKRLILITITVILYLIVLISFFFSSQEKKLQDEIDQLKKDMRDQDDIVKVRKVEVDKKESLISGYRNAYNQYIVNRDKLHDERKYDYFQLS